MERMDSIKNDSQNFAQERKTILVVEDEEALNELIVLVLAAEGYTVVSSRDGEEALQVYKKYWRDVVLVFSDYGLPNHHGTEVLRQIRDINPDVKFILTSGYLDDGMTSEILQAGADKVLWKPYSIDEVRRAVKGILEKSEGGPNDVPPADL